jgi:Tfp pilus assembly protein PilN
MKASYNLSPKSKKELTVWLSTTLLSILTIILVLIFINLKKQKELKYIQSVRISLQNSVSALEKDLIAKKIIAKNKEHLKKVFTKLNRYSNDESKGFMSKLLIDIASNVPSTIYLSQLDCTKKVEVLGYAVDVQSVLNLLQILSKLPYINHGKIVHLRTSNSSDSLLEFLIRLDLKADREYVQN